MQLPAQTVTHSSNSFGLSSIAASNSGFQFENPALLPEVKSYTSAAPGISLHYIKHFTKIQWNHQFQAKVVLMGLEAQINENVGAPRISAFELPVLRYQTTLSYPIRIVERFSISPKVGGGISFPFGLFSGQSGELEFSASVVDESSGREDIIYSGSTVVEFQFHPYFVSGLIFQYDTKRRLFFQVHLAYEISGSKWTSNESFFYAPKNIESDFSYKEGNVFTASLGIFLRGPFGKKRQQNPAYN